MSVVAIKKIAESSGADQSHNKKKRKYRVKTSAVTDTAEMVMTAVLALGIPAGYMVASIDADRMENPLWHEVPVEFQTPQWPGPEIDPTARPSILSSSYDEYTEGYYKDAVSGKLVLNSSGERFENFPVRRNGKLILQLVKNYEDFPAVFYDSIKYTRNASPVTIRGTTYDINTLLFLPATVQEITEIINGIKVTYFSTTFRLATDHKTHTDHIEDRGYKKLVSGKQQDIMIGTNPGSPPNSPYPLDGAGAPKTNASDEPATLDFNGYDSLDWGIDFE